MSAAIIHRAFCRGQTKRLASCSGPQQPAPSSSPSSCSRSGCWRPFWEKRRGDREGRGSEWPVLVVVDVVDEGSSSSWMGFEGIRRIDPTADSPPYAHHTQTATLEFSAFRMWHFPTREASPLTSTEDHRDTQPRPRTRQLDKLAQHICQQRARYHLRSSATSPPAQH